MERKSLRLCAADGGRPRLLLAEDSDPVRIVTAAMLKGMGCDVEAVIHGEHAVKCAAESRFDVIVLDIEMPVMDGITAARSIRRLGGHASGTPLMALSAFLADSMRTGHWRDTFDIALPKPANRNELHGAVTAALSWQQSQAAGEPEAPALVNSESLSAMRLGISEDIWAQLLDVACRDIEVCAGQLEHARHGGNDGVILTYAGKLSGLARTFACPRLACTAEAVQRATSETARARKLGDLVNVARSTVEALRG